ncbi:hypothetical protein [Haladaptatus cibarius]|uniref:hypothetical protein n=1 Tax=Haladaptatus cibarius TaxID=453847 RepID=UPI001185D9C2|nr:hypothetical protein [Haladaptatus cibarius]
MDSGLRQYTTQDFEALFTTSSAARTDLRSVGRLLEALHEHGIATYIDENYLYALGGKADIALRYAPLIGSMNNVLRAAEKFANASKRNRGNEYELFVIAIVCFCLEVGLFYVGAPYKLAWKGTHQLFFARSGTLFRLARYGGDRFVGFIMSEVHYELREALFDDAITADKAQWIVDNVNKNHEIPEFTSIRNDSAKYVGEVEGFTKDDLKQYEFAEEFVGGLESVSTAAISEVVELFSTTVTWLNKGGSNNKTNQGLVLKPDSTWNTKDQ